MSNEVKFAPCSPPEGSATLAPPRIRVGELGGDCTQRPLELDAAGPEDEWYFEVGEWFEDLEDEDFRARVDVRSHEIASEVTVGRLDGRPVVVTGGSRFDLSGPDLETLGGAVRVWDLRTGRKIGKTLTGHGLGVTALDTVPTERG